MKSLLFTLFYTKKGLTLLNEEFEDDLYRKSTIIWGIYGILIFALNSITQNNEFWILVTLLKFVLYILISVSIGTLFSSILYKTGNLIKGKASFIEIYSLFSYAFTPIIIGLILVNFLEN